MVVESTFDPMMQRYSATYPQDIAVICTMSRVCSLPQDQRGMSESTLTGTGIKAHEGDAWFPDPTQSVRG